MEHACFTHLLQHKYNNLQQNLDFVQQNLDFVQQNLDFVQQVCDAIPGSYAVHARLHGKKKP